MNGVVKKSKVYVTKVSVLLHFQMYGAKSFMGFLRSSTSPHVNPCLLILLCNFIYNLKTHVLVKRHLTLRRHFLLVGRRTVDGSQLFPGDCDHEEGGRISTKRLKRVNDVSHDESSGKAVRR